MAFLGSYFLCRLADDLVAPAQLIWVTALHQQSYGVPPPTCRRAPSSPSETTAEPKEFSLAETASGWGCGR